MYHSYNVSLSDHATVNYYPFLQCDDEGVTCPTLSSPPIAVNPAPIILTLLLLFLESIGAHGFIAFFASILLVLGFIKLSFGSVLFCRKTKQQEMADALIEKGISPKSESISVGKTIRIMFSITLMK